MAASISRGIQGRFSISSNRIKHIVKRSQHSRALYADVDVNDDAGYPPIKPRFPEGKDWGDMPSNVAWLWDGLKQEVAKIKTVQGKIDHLSKHSCRTWVFPAVQPLPQVLEYQQNITKTHLASGLPDIYKNLDVSEDIEICKAALQETIEVEHIVARERFFKKHKAFYTFKTDYDFSHTIVKAILNNLYFNLIGRHEHLFSSQFDENVYVKASWDRHGVPRFWPKERPKNPNYTVQNNSRFQTSHPVNFQVRTERPLPEFFPRDHEMFKRLEYPKLEYFPTVLGQGTKSMTPSFETGVNIGAPCEFTSLSVLLSNHDYLKRLEKKSGEKYAKENLIGYGLVSSFVSAVAQAYYQGFNTLEDLTYPITTQTVLTDGQHYLFFAYQLNTLQLWVDDTANPLRNMCWASGPHKLYETIEDGKIKGFDDTVLEQLVKFLALKPVDRGAGLRPNVDEHEKRVEVSEYIAQKKKVFVYEEQVEYAIEK